jgi:two-component system, OmpR family, sensor histidine kinase KdpD
MSDDSGGRGDSAGRSPLPPGRRRVGWALAVLAPAAATAVGVAAGQGGDLSTDVVLFFVATVAVALVGGLGPAVLAAALGGLLLNFFLTAPVYTFTVADRQNVVAIVAMVVVGVLVALVVDRAARRATQAAVARTEASLLAEAARTVLTSNDPLPRLLEQIRDAFTLDSVTVVERDHTEAGPATTRYPIAETSSDAGHPPTTDRTSASASASTSTGTGVEVEVEVDEGVGLLVRGHSLSGTERRVLEAVGGQALLALRHQRLLAQAAQARRQAEAEQLRSALLAALGHDLRTPLTAVKAALSSLRDPTLVLSESDRAELLATGEESTDRLIALVNNLLDSSRLAADAVRPHTSPVGYDEVVAAALAATTHPETERLRVEVDETLPHVLADPGLLERVVANLIDNALRHGGGAPVTVRAGLHSQRGELRVADNGPGLSSRTAERLFTPFQRFDDHPDAGGIGLGLHVARGFTEAMDGTLSAEPTPGGGLTMMISLPLADIPVITTEGPERAADGARR